jgi:hypothetical protein
MTKPEFLKIAKVEYDRINELKGEKSFYEYEERFEEIWIGCGKKVIEQNISKVGSNRRKKR